MTRTCFVAALVAMARTEKLASGGVDLTTVYNKVAPYIVKVQDSDTLYVDISNID